MRDTVTGDTRELPVTGLFVAIGHDPRNELVKGVVELDAEGGQNIFRNHQTAEQGAGHGDDEEQVNHKVQA